MCENVSHGICESCHFPSSWPPLLFQWVSGCPGRIEIRPIVDLKNHLSALDFQFNSVQLLNESSKRKKSATMYVAASQYAGKPGPTARAETVKQILAPSALSECHVLERTLLASTQQGNPPFGPPVRTDTVVLPTASPMPIRLIPPVRVF